MEIAAESMALKVMLTSNLFNKIGAANSVKMVFVTSSSVVSSLLSSGMKWLVPGQELSRLNGMRDMKAALAWVKGIDSSPLAPSPKYPFFSSCWSWPGRVCGANSLVPRTKGSLFLVVELVRQMRNWERKLNIALPCPLEPRSSEASFLAVIPPSVRQK